MLNNTLTTNEIKNATGSGLAFERVATGPGKQTEFKLSAETLGNPYRMTISHSRVGSGQSERRRSVVKFTAREEDANDGQKFETSAYIVVDEPTGRADNQTTLAGLIANILSFCATTGAASTVLFDGSGNGAKVLLNETL
jgi:hypothetical protein